MRALILLPRVDIVNSYVHLVPQYCFLRLRGDAPALDYLAHFKSLPADFEAIRSRLRIDATLTHLNRSARTHDYRDAYSSEMKNIVAQVYRKDAQLLGYDFEGLRVSTS